jgi:hypothetical protein
VYSVLKHLREYEDCAWVIVLYFGCYGLSFYPILSAQRYFLESQPLYSLLLFLPHGVRILSTWLLGARAIIPLLLGSWLCFLVFGHSSNSFLLWPAVVSAIVPFITFKMMQLAGLPSFATTDNLTLNWRMLALAGIIAALLNAAASHVLFSGELSASESQSFILTFIIGDVLGMALFMLISMMAFRWYRYKSSQLHS